VTKSRVCKDAPKLAMMPPKLACLTTSFKFREPLQEEVSLIPRPFLLPGSEAREK